MPQRGLLIDWTWPSKEPLRLKICQQKPPKLKSKENRPRTKTEQNVQGLCDNYKRCKIHIMRIPGEDKGKGVEKILETMETENFPQINVRQQTIDPGSSEYKEQI